MLYDEIDVDSVISGVIVCNGLEEADVVDCAVFVTFAEYDTDRVAVDELKKDVDSEIEKDSKTEYDDKEDCEVNGDIDNDNIDETEGLEEGLTSTDAEVDSIFDGVTEVVNSREGVEAMEED